VYATPHAPLLQRTTPGARTALTWCAAVALAYLVFLTYPAGARHFPPVGGFAETRLVLLATAIVMALPMLLLGRKALVVVALMLAEAMSLAVVLRETQIPAQQFLLVDIAICFIAATRPRRTSILATAVAVGVLFGYSLGRVLLLLLRTSAFSTTSELAAALTVVVAWMIGNSIHQRREYGEALRDQATIQAATAERLRIARELHDMVAHSIGIIAIQAAVGNRVIDTQPAEARNALATIEATSRETLAGLRRMLGVLRRAESDSTESAPAPGLADVDQLAAKARGAGVQVDVTWRGERRSLPAEIDQSAFRIVQEAVTNVARHAGAPRCQVSIDYRDDELCIEVVDDGSATPTHGIGYGIAGMRERVSLLHGQFSAGPRPEGGFRVWARLPA
jgi:signal transduction histidine kinase